MMDSKLVKIADIAEISAGLALRGAAPIAERGAYRILLPGSVTTATTVSDIDLPFCSLEAPSQRSLLNTGDLVFWGRGDIRCAVFDGPSNSVILAGPLLRLRRRREDLVPAFLALCMTSPSVTSQLTRAMRGTGSQFVSRNDLEEIEIIIPPVQTQLQLVEYSNLTHREAELSAKLGSLRQAIMTAMLTKTQNRQTSH